MLTILRSLALLDESFTISLVSPLKTIQYIKTLIYGKGGKPTVTMPSVLPTLKRKVGYNHDAGGEKRDNSDTGKRDKMAVDLLD